jgi:hypothetical protein
MTNSNKISGSRTLRKSSKKGSKKSSKKTSIKNNAVDFSSLLNDMDDEPQMNSMGSAAHPQMEGMMPGANMMMPGANMMMPGAEGMGSQGMMPMMSQMGMDPMGMAQMAMPQMGMPQMMMGADQNNVDPLHLHSFVPRNENVNINNYGVSQEQLMSGSQMSQQFAGRQAGGSRVMRGGANFKVKSGQYVVRPSRYAAMEYIVTIENNNGKEIAYVIFSNDLEQNKKVIFVFPGGFRQTTIDDYSKYDKNEIIIQAESYARDQGVPVPIEPIT